ncbi:MAG: hypothetical protein KAT30_07050, partial [Candidatus Krumholzibacteria bacterium]|nr:hypothetical protein [Candidatus Krumholzibacteria bacterium]
MRTLIRSLKGHLKWTSLLTSLFVLVLAQGSTCDNGDDPVAPPAKESAFTFEVSPPDVGLEPGTTTLATVSIDRDPGASGTDFSGDIAF